MNILLLSEMFPPHAGGSRVYYYHLCKSLLSQFDDRIVVLTKKVPGWKEFDGAETTRNLRVIRHGKPLQTTKYHELPKIAMPLAEAAWLCQREKIDMVHAGDLYPAGVIALLLKKTLGIPYLAYCHGEISQTDRYRYQPIVRNWIYRNADAVVANSEYTRESLLGIGVAENRIHKITPGVALEEFTPRPVNSDLVRQLSLHNRRVLLTVGRLVSRKNHATVIRAVAKIAGELRDLKYVIAGEGPEQENLRKLAEELGIADIVVFAGRVPAELLPDYYNLCDLFVLPNCEDEGGDVEGFGMVFLEANSSGKAVIGGRSGGTTDAVVDGVTGCLVEPTNVDELAAAMKRLLVDADLRGAMSRAGLQRARSEFDWQSRGRRVREISIDVVEERNNRRIPNRAGIVSESRPGKSGGNGI